MEGGVQGVALHRELAVPGDIVLPGQGPDALKQLVEGGGGEGAQLHQHPGAAAEVDIQAGDVRRRALAVDAAVFRPDILHIQPAQLVGHQGLQSQKTGNGQDHGQFLLFQDCGSFLPAQYTRKRRRMQSRRGVRYCNQNEMFFTDGL